MALLTVRPGVIAHRGASGIAPELTLAAFELAIRSGADFIELDVRMSRDGEIVVIHDRRLSRTTNGRGTGDKKTLSQLKELDAGSWFNRAYPSKARSEFAGQRIPTLPEVVDLVSSSTAGLYVEIKDPDLYPPDFESRILSVIHQKRLRKRVTVLSFDSRSLKKVKGLAPNVRIGLLANDLKSNPLEAALAVRADELALRHTLLSDTLAADTKAAGLSLSVWTVNKEKDLKRMIESGVDRITTNYPDRLIQLLRSMTRDPAGQNT